MEIIEKYSDKPWDWHTHIYYNPNFDIMVLLEKYPHKNWDFKELSCLKGLKLDFVETYPHKDWDFTKLSYLKELTLDFVQRYPEKPWNYDIFVASQDITIDFVDKYSGHIKRGCEYFDTKIDKRFESDINNEMIKINNESHH